MMDKITNNNKYVDKDIVSVSYDELFTDKVDYCSVIIFNNNNKNF